MVWERVKVSLLLSGKGLIDMSKIVIPLFGTHLDQKVYGLEHAKKVIGISQHSMRSLIRDGTLRLH